MLFISILAKTPSKKSMHKVASTKSVPTMQRHIFDSVEQAQEQAMKCLESLANVQQYFETVHYQEVDLTRLFEMIEVPEKDVCGKRGLPHIHARLNGIPVILARFDSNRKPEVIVVSSSTDLLIKSNKSVNV